MPYPTSDNFKKHSQNLSKVSAALVQIERVHKAAVRDNDQAAERALRVVHTMLIAVFAEAQLRKIIDDPTGFSAAERRFIWAMRSQDGRWKRAIEAAAARHYGTVNFDLSSLPEADAKRLTQVKDLIGSHLAPVITDRNKLAHGQWRHQLKSLSDDRFRSEPMRLDYNYEEIVGRHRLLQAIAQMVHVLCVSEPTFRRDFDRWTRQIVLAAQRATGDTYPDLKAQLQRSRARARRKDDSGASPSVPVDG